MIKRIKNVFTIYLFLNALTVLPQTSGLHLLEQGDCIPSKYKDTISSVEQSYNDGVMLYNEVFNNGLIEKEKVNKLIGLFKIQVSTKAKLQEIWELSDSALRENSKEYFTEASNAFKELIDTIDFTNLNFKSAKSALIAVEKSHQVILLQKFGLQLLFGCIRVSSDRLEQPTDISNDIVINIDMIERFRKVWNELSYPTTYDQWVYKPTERKSFMPSTYSDLLKENRLDTKKKAVAQDSSKQTLNLQSSLAINSSTASGDIKDATKDKSNLNINGGSNKGNKNMRSTGSNWNNKGNSQNYSIKGEGNRLEINQNTQIINLTTQSKLRSLSIDYFTIQIAASKNRLVIEKLRKELYCGNFEIEERDENDWYKYLIGHFTSIDSANKYLASPCITRGFVSGYNTKGRVAILSVRQPIIPSGFGSTYSVVYRLQIAASRQPLSSETLSMVYKGFNPINILQEDGWYRYSIGDYIYYDEAKVARDSCGTKDAFVMPYQNGKRIQWPGKAALELLKIKQNENPIYVVQVAASRKPLPLQIIKNIIEMESPLTMKFEDGWYKYYISAFTDFAAAKEESTKVGIKGAFIATYKHGIRVKP